MINNGFILHFMAESKEQRVEKMIKVNDHRLIMVLYSIFFATVNGGIIMVNKMVNPSRMVKAMIISLVILDIYHG